MVSLRELQENCRWDRNPGIPGDKIMDALGVRFAWLLLKTSITPNQITITGTVLGIIGIYFVAMMNGIYSLIGYISILGYAILDYADGVVARYHKSVSFKGKYYDALGHFITPLIFVAAGSYTFRNSGLLTPLLLGVTATFLNLSLDLNFKLPSLITGLKMQQLYLSSNENQHSNKIYSFIKRKILILNKNMTFGTHLIFFFSVTHIVNLVWPNKGIWLTIYLLVVFIAIFAVTFLYQIIVNVIILDKIDKKDKLRIDEK